jgi:hypothetical protein
MNEELFLAIPFHTPPQNQALFKLFTSNENYLSLRAFDGALYLGKSLPARVTYEELLDRKAHVTSLISRLFPTTPHSLLLLSHVSL